MKRTLLVYLLLLLLLASTFTSCGREAQKFSEYSFDYFDTVTTVTGYADSQEEFDAIADEVFSLLGEYHRLFTIYHRYDGMENLCTVNELVDGAHRTVTVDRRIIDMLLYAKQAYEMTGGKVNVAMGSVLSVWHEYREDGMDEPWNAQLPPMARLQEAAQHTDIDKVLIDEQACTVTLADPQMRLDVGAIAKGYAVEMVARQMEQKGIAGYVINVGGNVRTLGAKPDGSGWTVGIENPADDAEDYLAYLQLDGESLITSGSYQRYYVVEGKRYHHIIDPVTLMPADYFTSVSIVCDSSADGDALSTALFCMTYQEGLALIESLDGVEAMWLTVDGKQYYSSGFSNYQTEY
ncbi:MAG: FAD:protein FMN transferase [Ruminococcaceae bacterium]|nr:FAD:protein FMN transferase [Oscillospiraceae bacterium]